MKNKQDCYNKVVTDRNIFLFQKLNLLNRSPVPFYPPLNMDLLPFGLPVFGCNTSLIDVVFNYNNKNLLVYKDLYTGGLK